MRRSPRVVRAAWHVDGYAVSSSEERSVSGGRRSAIAVQAERRAQERAARLGGEIRTMRRLRKWAQGELGRRAEVGRMVISRLERGTNPLAIETLDRIGLALGVPLAVGFDRDLRHDVADAGHLAMQELVLRAARSAGFVSQFEMPTRPNEPWRSSDIGLGMPARRLAIDVECWNTFGDVGAATRSSRRKLVELEQLALAAWGGGARVGLVWIVRETDRNRALINRYGEVFASLFTGSSRAWVPDAHDRIRTARRTGPRVVRPRDRAVPRLAPPGSYGQRILKARRPSRAPGWSGGSGSSRGTKHSEPGAPVRIAAGQTPSLSALTTRRRAGGSKLRARSRMDSGGSLGRAIAW